MHSILVCSSFKKSTILFSFLFLSSISIFSQIVGGREPNQFIPRAMEADPISGDQFLGNVNLFNGAYQGSYSLGSLSTPGGVSFDLKMNYSSNVSGGSNVPVSSGIPYGEGWSLDLPYIKVESDPYRKYSQQERANYLVQSPTNPNPYTADLGLDSREGDLYWHSIYVNIPGKLSCRAVYKYSDTLGQHIFAPYTFENYAEIILSSDKWKVILDDGTMYEFFQVQETVRAASNDRGAFDYYESDTDIETGDRLKNQTLPKVAVLKWLCTTIRNRNIPGQSISFYYDKYGKFNFFKEYSQPGIEKRFRTLFGITEDYTTYREVFLKRISTEDPFSTGDEIILEYETKDEDVSTGSGMLKLDQPKVERYDSLYSYKTVYIRGAFTSGDYTSANNKQSGFANWYRYYHGAHPDIVSGYEDGLSGDGIISTINGLNPYLRGSYYHRKQITGGSGAVSFNHAYLESERLDLDEQWIGGDLYEIKSSVSNSSNQRAFNIDINLATGKNPSSMPTSPGPNGTEMVNTANYDSELSSTASAKESIFSTFNSALKWNTRGNTVTTAQNSISTSNFFSMPNLPADHEGFSIQIGPANSDHVYNANANVADKPNPAPLSAKSAFYGYNAIKIGSTTTETPYHQRVSSNFGIGMPWFMMRTAYQTIGSNSIGSSSTDYNFWMNLTNGNSHTWPNEPTMSGGATLNRVELIRYSKNPYMLSSVKKYIASGTFDGSSTDGKTLASQLDMDYTIATPMLIENKNYDNGDPLVTNTNRQQNIFLLSAIKNIPVDPSGSALSVNTSVTPTTHFSYSLQRQLNYNSNYFHASSIYLLTGTTNALGKETQIKYHGIESDTIRAFKINGLTAYENNQKLSLPSTALGRNEATQMTFMVEKIKEKVNNTDFRTWNYEYELALSAHTPSNYVNLSGKFDSRSARSANEGYQTVKVTEPETDGVRNYTVYKYYFTSQTNDLAYYYNGKLKSIEKFDHDHSLSQKKDFTYEAIKAYEGGFFRHANEHDQFAFDYIDYFLDERPTDVDKTTFYSNYFEDTLKRSGRNRYAEFKFYEDVFKSAVGENASASYFVKKVREKTTTYDNDCAIAGYTSGDFVGGSGNGGSNDDSYPEATENNASNENEEALIELIGGAESYGDIEESLLENSPLSDNILFALLLNSNLREELNIVEGAEELSLEIENLLNAQIIGEDFLYFILTEEALAGTNFFDNYVNNFEIAPSEWLTAQMISYAGTFQLSTLQTILSGNSGHSNAILFQMLEHTPVFSEAFVEAVMLSQTEISDSVLVDLVHCETDLSGARMESILLNQPNYVAEWVLLEFFEQYKTNFPGNLMNVLLGSSNALPASVLRKVEDHTQLFTPENIKQLHNGQVSAISSSPSCDNTPLGQTVSQVNITDFEYYDADYKGVTTSKGYLDLFGSSNTSAYLKYEPSWQLYSTKNYSPNHPEAFQEERYYYYYDLKNRYDRYDVEYPVEVDWSGVGTDIDPITFDSSLFDDFLSPDLHVNVESNSAGIIINDYFKPHGMTRSIRHRLRNIPYQQMSVSNNGTIGEPHKQSKYFIYDSRWGDNDQPYSTSRLDQVSHSDPCPTAGSTLPSDCSIFTPYPLSNVIITKHSWYYRDTVFLNVPPDAFIIRVDHLVGLNYHYFIQPTSCKKSSYGTDTTVVFDSRILPSVFNDPNNPPPPPPNQALPTNDFWDFSNVMLFKATVLQVDTEFKGDASGFTDKGKSSLSTLLFGNKDLLHFWNSGTAIAPSVSYPEYSSDYYAPEFPYDYIYDYRVIERNVHTLPVLTQDRTGVKTRYIYDPMVTVKRYDTQCNRALSPYFELGNRDKPSKVILNAGESDSSIVSFEYYSDLSLKKVTEEDYNTSKSYRYDEYGKIREERRDGKLINRYSYGFWNGDDTKSFTQRAADNYVESIHFPNDSDQTAFISRKYNDPLGRAYQTVSGELVNGVNSTDVLAAEYSGRVIYDNRNRVLEQYKAFAYENGGSGFSLVPRTASTNTAVYPDIASTYAYESGWKGRLIAAAKPGENLTTGRKVQKSYELMNSYCFACDISLNNLSISLLMPEGIDKDYVFNKVTTTDEDGKESSVYTNALGQTVATQQIDASGDLTTVMAYDKQGNQSTILNPKNQRSSYKYNIMGWMYEQETPDGGITRYRYNQLGKVALKQDEKGRKGRNVTLEDNSQATLPYANLYYYDDMGRLIKVEERYHLRNDGFLGTPLNSELTLTEDWHTNTLKAFSNASTYSWMIKFSESSYNWSNSSHEPNPDIYKVEQIGIPRNPNLYHSAGYDPLRFRSEGILLRKIGYENAYLNPLGLSSNISAKIYPGTNLKERLNYSYGYNEQPSLDLGELSNITTFNDNRITEATFYKYTVYGEVSSLIKVFNQNGIASTINPEFVSTQSYEGFTNDGLWSTNNVDIHADDVMDLQHHRVLDARGRVTEVYANYTDSKAGGNKIVSYNYDNAYNRLSTKRNFYSYGSGPTHHQSDISDYTYDNRDRLTQVNGDWLNYQLYYDNNQASNSGHTPAGDLNYNGNINGIKATYTLSNATNYTGNLFNLPTVYNYEYDGLNRLTKADAAVGDLLNGTNPTHASYLMGDVDYTYDVVGNLEELKRYIGVNNELQHWLYQYSGNTNKLSGVSSQSSAASRNYTYDEAGNLISDDSREINNILYNVDNLPLRISEELTGGGIGNPQFGAYTDYNYDGSGQRIYKKEGDYADDEPNAPIEATYYLRDIDGKSIAEYDLSGNIWTYYIHGQAREAAIQPWYTLQPGYSSTAPTAETNHFRVDHYVTDHLGNTRVVIRSLWDDQNNELKNELVGAYDYYPYGKILRKYVPGGGIERYLTTGHERDHETLSENNDGTGFDYRFARMGDSDVPKFNSIDPAAAEYPSWSPYAYVLGNPIRFIDPDGRRAWKPEIGDDGTTSYTAETGDNAETFASQYGLSQTDANKVLGGQDIQKGTIISGQQVFNALGREALRLDLTSPQATSQRIFDQFLYARDYAASKGQGTFQSAEFYSNRLEGSSSGWGGAGTVSGRAYMNSGGQRFGIKFNLPLYRSVFDGSSNSVSMGVSPTNSKPTSGNSFPNQSNVRFPMFHPETGAQSQGFDVFMSGSNVGGFFNRFSRQPQRHDYSKTILNLNKQ